MCGFITCIKDEKVVFPDFSNSKENLIRRGPDYQSEFILNNFYCYHSRLSIIDLDSRSNQPFFSSCGRFIILYNGEIYNYEELSVELKNLGIDFRTSSDTEVILELYLQYKDEMLTKLRGMFSFFIWDKLEQTGFIARDPYGIKPLYFYTDDKYLIFASQLKALPLNFSEELINDNSKLEFFLFGSISEKSTIFKNIECFKSGYKMSISKNTIIEYSQWYDLDSKFDTSIQDEKISLISEEILFRNLNERLNKTVKYHSVSDVKIGIFLSSGIDSSTLASFLIENNSDDIQGVTVVFQDDNNNESLEAIKLAKDFGIPLYIKNVTKEEFYSDIDEIFNAMDQPTVDGINTWYATKAAAECNLKVVFSGVGADELFNGYNYYKWMPSYMKIAITFLRIPLLNNFLIKISQLLSIFSNRNKLYYSMEWLQNFRTAWLLKRAFLVPNEILDKKLYSSIYTFEKINSKLIEYADISSNSFPLDVLIKYDNLIYLRHQLLRDSDWASMYHGVELRTPFVDKYFLESVLPYRQYFGKYENKEMLYANLKYKLPQSIIKRKKTGFSIPVKKWIYAKYGLNSNYEYANFILSKYFKSLNVNFS